MQAADKFDLHGRWPFCTRSRSQGQFVVRAEATKRHPALLEAINGGQIPAFATRGLVGVPSLPQAQFTPAPMGGATTSQIITLAPSVTIQAEGGTREQNVELAHQTAKAMESVMRRIVVNEMRAQMRPGGMLR